MYVGSMFLINRFCQTTVLVVTLALLLNRANYHFSHLCWSFIFRLENQFSMNTLVMNKNI